MYKRQVNIFSIGLTTLGIRDITHVTMESLSKALQRIDEPRMDAFSIATGYDRKKSANAIHIGENYDNLKHFAQQPHFKSQLSKIIARIERLKAEPHFEMNIVSICRQGRHRSVGEARLFAEVFRCRGFVVRGPRHLSRADWWVKQCDRCDMCDVRCTRKLKVFDAAAELF